VMVARFVGRGRHQRISAAESALTTGESAEASSHR
jgi:hypothetical protein